MNAPYTSDYWISDVSALCASVHSTSDVNELYTSGHWVSHVFCTLPVTVPVTGVYCILLVISSSLLECTVYIQSLYLFAVSHLLSLF